MQVAGSDHVLNFCDSERPGLLGWPREDVTRPAQASGHLGVYEGLSARKSVKGIHHYALGQEKASSYARLDPLCRPTHPSRRA